MTEELFTILENTVNLARQNGHLTNEEAEKTLEELSWVREDSMVEQGLYIRPIH